MHELSIAQSLIEAACDAATSAEASQVTRVRIRVGALSGVVRESLLFSFELAAEGTPCEGARLDVEESPLTVMCPQCDAVKTLSDVYRFTCPDCGAAISEIISGRELDLLTVEIASAPNPST